MPFKRKSHPPFKARQFLFFSFKLVLIMKQLQEPSIFFLIKTEILQMMEEINSNEHSNFCAILIINKLLVVVFFRFYFRNIEIKFVAQVFCFICWGVLLLCFFFLFLFYDFEIETVFAIEIATTTWLRSRLLIPQLL